MLDAVLGGLRARGLEATTLAELLASRLTYALWVYAAMARAATTADAFNAVAEPRRRQILDALAGGERPVNDLVRLLGLAQPQVSKHLQVLERWGRSCVTKAGSACAAERPRSAGWSGQALAVWSGSVNWMPCWRTSSRRARRWR